jgi:PLP dependent protein
MSGDLEAAITAGATIVRVGTALFGNRPLVSGIEAHQSHEPQTPRT